MLNPAGINQCTGCRPPSKAHPAGSARGARSSVLICNHCTVVVLSEQSALSQRASSICTDDMFNELPSLHATVMKWFRLLPSVLLLVCAKDVRSLCLRRR